MLRTFEDPDTEAGRWDPKVRLLNYEPDTKPPYASELFDAEPDKSSEADGKAAPYIRTV